MGNLLSEDNKSQWEKNRIKKHEEHAKIFYEVQQRKIQATQIYIRNKQSKIHLNKIFEELPYELKFDVLNFLSSNLTQEEKDQYNKIKNNYQKKTYYVSALALVSAFIFPLPFKSISRANKTTKLFIWIGIFGLTHQAGMYSIQYEVDQFHDLIIGKYEEILLEKKFLD